MLRFTLEGEYVAEGGYTAEELAVKYGITYLACIRRLINQKPLTRRIYTAAKFLTADGEHLTLREAATKYCMSESTARYRIRHGISLKVRLHDRQKRNSEKVRSDTKTCGEQRVVAAVSTGEYKPQSWFSALGV